MKPRLTFIIMLLFSIWSTAHAQITLDASNTLHSPSFSDTVRVVELIDLPFELEGENIAYNFSAHFSNYGYISDFSPATRMDFPADSRFDVGEGVLGPLTFSSELYTRKDSTGISQIGAYKISETVNLEPLSGNPLDKIVFPGNNKRQESPFHVLKFPSVHGATWSVETVIQDDFFTTITGFGLASVPSQQKTSISREYEQVGWGELILPTVNGPSIPYDAIVIKETRTAVDSIFLGGAPAPGALLSALGISQGAENTETYYRFYAENFETELLLIWLSQDLQSIARAEYASKGLQAAKLPIHVDIDAADGGDGSSWSTAYNNINTAIENANANDEIWVADGTYIPDVPSVSPDPTKRMFLYYKDVQLYGGFSGTESSRSERDPLTNKTILSGDIAGDDAPNNLVVNREDNINNVVYVVETVTNAAVLDGCIIKGGHADGDVAIYSDIRGAGMFSFGPIQLQNCKFTENYAQNHGGGGYYYESAAAGGKVINCEFDQNEAGMNGGGLFAAFVAGDGVEIDSSTFTRNIANDNGGGFIGVRSNITISNSIFSANQATNSGGGIDISNCYNPTISNSFFSNNSAGSTGGGALINILTSNQTATITNCEFNSNSGATGGGISCQGNEMNNHFEITGCTIIGNTSQGALATGAGIDVSYNGNAIGGIAYITNCRIQNNSIDGSGGGISLRDQANNNNELIVNNCDIINNTATFSAGGLLFYKASNSNTPIRITQSSFTDNSSNGALAIGVLSLGTFNPDQSLLIDNNEFVDHNGTAGTTSVIRVESMKATLLNNTITGATSGLSGNENTEMILQNNIIYSPDFDSVLNPGNSTNYISRGGNLFGDDSANAWAQPEDQQSTDPLFEIGSTYLSENSPAIDMGILPEIEDLVDIDSLDRVQGSCIDIGARESAFDANLSSCLTLTSVKEEIISAGNATIFPNPINTYGQLQITNEWLGNINVTIVNTLGQTIQNYTIEKYSVEGKWDLDTRNLRNGNYQIILSNGRQLMIKPFIIIQ